MVPQFDHYDFGGRTLCCEFKCQRCATTAVVPLEQCVPNDEGSRFLRNLKCPKGWSDHFYGWMLCPDCTEKLKEFMKGGASSG